MLFAYLILLILFIVASTYSLWGNFSFLSFLIILGGLISTSRLFLQELSKKYLPVYFFLTRQKLRFFTDTTSKWWFHARYNVVSEDAFYEIDKLIKNTRFAIKIKNKNDREIELLVNETITLRVAFTPENESFLNHNQIDITSNKIEVSYNHTKHKLETEIEPLLQLFDDWFKSDSRSYQFNVDFMKDNPFFNVYIANLSQSKVEDFKVILHVDGNSPKSKSDRIEISSRNMRITADSTNSFKKLAENFVMLTPDTKLLIGDKNA